MPKYIQTKIRRLDNGEIEIESKMVVSTVVKLSDKDDNPDGISAAKRKTREAIFAKLYQQTRNDAIRAFSEIAAEINTQEFGWMNLRWRKILDNAFAPLLSAGKWLEEDAGDSGE